MVSYRKIINPQVRFRKHSILLFFQCVVPFFRSYEIQPVPSRLTSGNFIQTSYNVKVANIFLITNTLKNIYNEVYPKIPRNSIGLISGLNERLCFIASRATGSLSTTQGWILCFKCHRYSKNDVDRLVHNHLLFINFMRIGLRCKSNPLPQGTSQAFLQLFYFIYLKA